MMILSPYFQNKKVPIKKQSLLFDYASNSEHVQIIDMVHTLRASVAQSPISIPSISIHILPLKFHKPISVIGFIDTGAQKRMLHPSILPPNCWVKHIENFKTCIITKAPIRVQIFPNYVIWSKIIGSELLDKDLLIGFDLLALSKRLQITAAGVSYKRYHWGMCTWHYYTRSKTNQSLPL